MEMICALLRAARAGGSSRSGPDSSCDRFVRRLRRARAAVSRAEEALYPESAPRPDRAVRRGRPAVAAPEMSRGAARGALARPADGPLPHVSPRPLTNTSAPRASRGDRAPAEIRPETRSLIRSANEDVDNRRFSPIPGAHAGSSPVDSWFFEGCRTTVDYGFTENLLTDIRLMV